VLLGLIPLISDYREQILFFHASKIVSPIAGSSKIEDKLLVRVSASPVKIKTHSARLFLDE
jgi:hypothetical protein